jgi:hypothetical protein
MVNKQAAEREVIENLENAIANGYSFEGMTLRDIALEMVEYTGSIELSTEDAMVVIDEYLASIASRTRGDLR